MKSVCKNHPERESKQKCHYCQEYICTDCQLTIAHHIYCSKRCYRREAFNHYLSNLKLLFSFFVDFLKDKKLLTFRNMLDFILVVGIILSLTLGLNNNNILKKISAKAESQLKETSLDSIAEMIDTLTLFSPPPTAMVLRNRFDIEGETEENRIVSLSGNGKLIEATVARGRRFCFNNVSAKPGQNHFVVRSMDEEGNSIILEEIKIYYSKPSSSYLSRDFQRGSLQEKKITLTFDGGYLDNAASEILDILEQEQVKVTIFLTGVFLKKYPTLVKRMAEAGHEIGNHTWTHPHLTSYAENKQHNTLPEITPELIQQQLLRTAELFKKITGKEMAPLWRAPYGEHNKEIRQWAADAGFRHIGWTIGKNWEEGMDTMDWVADKNSLGYHSAEEIANKVLSFGNKTEHGANGTIILMHLGTLRNDDYPHQKLPMIIDQLKEKGYEFVTISGLL